MNNIIIVFTCVWSGMNKNKWQLPAQVNKIGIQPQTEEMPSRRQSNDFVRSSLEGNVPPVKIIL